MPIYEYECRSCGHQFEFLLLPSTTPLCPQCKSLELERLLSAFAVSSEGIRRSYLNAAKRKRFGSRDVKDKQIADREYIEEHAREDGFDPVEAAARRKEAAKNAKKKGT